MKLRMMVRMALAIFLIGVGLFLLYSSLGIVRDELLPVMHKGRLTVTTSSTILNRTWQGNEIYLLLLGYIVVAGASLYGGYRMVRASERRRGAPASHERDRQAAGSK